MVALAGHKWVFCGGVLGRRRTGISSSYLKEQNHFNHRFLLYSRSFLHALKVHSKNIKHDSNHLLTMWSSQFQQCLRSPLPLCVHCQEWRPPSQTERSLRPLHHSQSGTRLTAPLKANQTRTIRNKPGETLKQSLTRCWLTVYHSILHRFNSGHNLCQVSEGGVRTSHHLKGTRVPCEALISTGFMTYCNCLQLCCWFCRQQPSKCQPKPQVYTHHIKNRAPFSHCVTWNYNKLFPLKIKKEFYFYLLNTSIMRDNFLRQFLIISSKSQV